MRADWLGSGHVTNLKPSAEAEGRAALIDGARGAWCMMGNSGFRRRRGADRREQHSLTTEGII